VSSERVIKISMQAQVSNYIAGMKQVQAENQKAAKTAGDAQAQFEAQNQAMTGLGVGLLAVGALAAAGVGLAIKKYAEFDQAMSNVQAATHESTANMALLRDAALEAGAKTVYSATEAATAIEELAKAGLSTADILGGALDGALSLASAGGLSVADAAATAATALTLFKLKGSDIPHVADLLAAGAGKAQGSVDDLSQALNQGGLVAAQAGFSIEDTTGVLAAFASAGLKGSDAGTSLKTAILALQKPSSLAQAAMDQYGISVYDSNGKMLSFSGIAGQLKDKLGGLTDEQRNAALATIFGNDAVRSAAVLYSNGAKGIDGWNKKVNDSGYAADTARQRINNLNGDLEQLGGSFDTALIKSGSAANEVLRGIVQTATNAVNAFGAAPPVVQGTALALGALAAATLLAGGAFLVGVPKIAQFQTSLALLKDSTMPGVAAGAARIEGAVGKAGTMLGKAASFLTGPWGIALAAGTIAVDQLFKMIAAGQTTTAQFENSLKNAASGAELLRQAAQSDGLTTSLFGDYGDALKHLPALLDKAAAAQNNWGNRLSLSANELGAIDGLDRLGDSLATLAAKDLPSAQKAFRSLSDQNHLNKEQQAALLETMPALKDALVQQATTLGVNVSSSDKAANATALLKLAMGSAKPTAIEAGDAYLKAADDAKGLDDKLRNLIDTVNAANGVGQDAVSSNASYQQSLADLKTTIDDIDPATGKARTGAEAFQHTLDQGTAAGSANAAMLADLAAKGEDAAAKQFALDGNTAAYTASLQANHDAVYQNALAISGNADEAQKLADKVAAMPTEKQIKFLVDTAAAAKAIDIFIDGQSGKTIWLNAKTSYAYSSGTVGGIPQGRGNENGGLYNRGVKAFENGGFPSGIYPGRPGGIHKFAEDKLPWETYISPKPGHEQENIGYAMESLRRLGVKPQYATSSPGYSSAPTSMQVTNHNTLTAPAIETQDSAVYATILGRSFERALRR
jgi:TP901 family phage tail tape measure protein